MQYYVVKMVNQESYELVRKLVQAMGGLYNPGQEGALIQKVKDHEKFVSMMRLLEARVVYLKQFKFYKDARADAKFRDKVLTFEKPDVVARRVLSQYDFNFADALHAVNKKKQGYEPYQEAFHHWGAVAGILARWNGGVKDGDTRKKKPRKRRKA